MANNLTASFPEYWSKRMQVTHLKKAVYRGISSFEEQATLKKGDTVHRPYRSAMTVNALGSEGNYTRQDITDTDESLVINQEKEVSFYVRDIDRMQSNYDTTNEYADEASTRLTNWIDGDVLGEYDQAISVVDDAAFGGSSGNGVTATTSNVHQIFSVAGRKLNLREITEMSKRWAVVSPHLFQTIIDAMGGRESALGDQTFLNGDAGKFGGFNLKLSTATGYSAVLALATQPTDGDTVTINGVVFTFKTTLGTTAGNVLIGADADAARLNLTTLINAPTATTAQGVALSAANLKLMKGIVGTNDASANTLTLKAEGLGYVSVSETLTAAADIWTAATQLQHCLFGQGTPIDVVIQKQPNTLVKERDGYIGKDIVSYTVYGVKTFAEGKDQMVDVKLNSSAF